MLFRECRDLWAEAYALAFLSYEHATAGRPKQARDLALEGVQAASTTGDRGAESRALLGLGASLLASGDIDAAIKQFVSALAIAKEIQDKYVEAQIMGLLGSAHLQQRAFPKAASWFEHQMVVAREIENLRYQGDAQFQWALALDSVGERERAIKLLHGSVDLLEETESPNAAQARQKLSQWSRIT